MIQRCFIWLDLWSMIQRCFICCLAAHWSWKAFVLILWFHPFVMLQCPSSCQYSRCWNLASSSKIHFSIWLITVMNFSESPDVHNFDRIFGLPIILSLWFWIGNLRKTWKKIVTHWTAFPNWPSFIDSALRTRWENLEFSYRPFPSICIWWPEVAMRH